MQGLKMSRKLIICVAVSLILTSVYAARRSLNSITDLTNCPLSERTNIIELLHWFANEVNIDDRICLTFDPTCAYGSHHYGNFGNLLDPLPRGYQYYTIGNLYEDDSESLPDYVRNPRRRNINHNKARIIIRVNKGNAAARAGQTIDQVYITQHYDGSDDYDPDHTYRITPSLLQAVRRRGIDELQQLVSRSQRENPSTHLHGSDIQFTQQSRHNPRTNNDHDFLKKILFAILCIFVMAALSILADMNNRKY